MMELIKAATGLSFRSVKDVETAFASDMSFGR
jgi:hypothetical protein